MMDFRILLRVLALILAMAGSGVVAQQIPQSALQMQLSFVPLVKQATPAVVNIYAKIERPAQSSPFQGDPFFGQLFGGAFGPRPRVQNSLGSGVILSPDGIVVSNYHVVGEATDIRVVLSDRREYAAQVLLGDADSDLAILQLENASDLPHLTLRASDTVEVGELVLAIGNPFGVGQTVSSGIVSGLARSGTASGSGKGYYLQTDAPINPGNSGGALVDVSGNLIGINTRILTRSGGSNGIGFAIPADLVGAFVNQAKEGRTSFGRPWAGINGQPVDADMADALGFDLPGGIVVSAVHRASPFRTAGLRVGDVIAEVNDQPVNSPAEMIYRMSVSGLSQTARITLVRRGEVSVIDVDLIEAPDDPPRESLQLSRREVLEGLTLLTINPAVLAEFNLPLDAVGVLVEQTGRLGRTVGLLPGDVITAVNDRPTAHPDDVAAMFAARSRGYVLDVARGSQRLRLRFGV